MSKHRGRAVSPPATPAPDTSERRVQACLAAWEQGSVAGGWTEQMCRGWLGAAGGAGGWGNERAVPAGTAQDIPIRGDTLTLPGAGIFFTRMAWR